MRGAYQGLGILPIPYKWCVTGKKSRTSVLTPDSEFTIKILEMIVFCLFGAYVRPSSCLECTQHLAHPRSIADIFDL